MVDVAAAREAHNKLEISNVGLIAGTVNPADRLPKPKFRKPLFDIPPSGIDTSHVDQWIIGKK